MTTAVGASLTERPACAYCNEGDHFMCRPDVVPCGCARNDHRDGRWPFNEED